jgi:hypothetical protein
VAEELERPRVVPPGDYEYYRWRVHYTTELLWVLGASEQVLELLHRVLVTHNDMHARQAPEAGGRG